MSAPRRRLGDLPFVALLTGAWVLLWGHLSLANLLTGAVAAVVLLAVFPFHHDLAVVRHRLRPVAALRLLGAVVAEVLASNLVMVRDVLGGSGRERPGVVACPLRVEAPGLVTFLTNLLSMGPGTMPIDVAEQPPILYLHVLRLQDPDAVRAKVSRLERLAVLALGDDDAVAAVAVPAPPPPHRRPGRSSSGGST